MRISRKWLAGLMILGFASAQFISLAHACAGMGVFDVTTHAIAGSAAAMPADCPAVADGAPFTGAACEAHCGPREQVDNGADIRAAAIAPASPLILRPVHFRVPALVRAVPPRIAAPPLSVLFGRFLI